MLKTIFFICIILHTIIVHSQNIAVSPLEYKVSRAYFQEHYVKDTEDQKIADLFVKKNKSVLLYVALGAGSTILASYTSTIALSQHVTMSPFTPVTLSLITLSIVKGARYSRKKKFMYITGTQELPPYVKNRIN